MYSSKCKLKACSLQNILQIVLHECLLRLTKRFEYSNIRKDLKTLFDSKTQISEIFQTVQCFFIKQVLYEGYSVQGHTYLSKHAAFLFALPLAMKKLRQFTQFFLQPFW